MSGLSDANLSKLELCEVIREHVPDFVILRIAHRRGPGQARLHRVERQDRGDGVQAAFSLDDGIEELIKGYQMLSPDPYGNV